jgi:putative toxin-antitoxin system antitoxin component (TIGR02293 family)
MKAHKVTGDECTSLLAMFWRFNVAQEQMTESQRLKSIQAGFMPSLYEAVRFTFQLQDKQIEVLLSTSISALERLRRHHKKLDLVASERLDRIASVSHLATAVFEDKQAAIDWLSRSNEVLGDQPPIMLCETEIGAKQIRRVLHAMEWGGAA